MSRFQKITNQHKTRSNEVTMKKTTYTTLISLLLASAVNAEQLKSHSPGGAGQATGPGQGP